MVRDQFKFYMALGNPQNPEESGSSFFVLVDDFMEPKRRDQFMLSRIDEDELLEFLNTQTGDPFFANKLDFVGWDPGVASRFNVDYAAVFHVK